MAAFLREPREREALLRGQTFLRFLVFLYTSASIIYMTLQSENRSEEIREKVLQFSIDKSVPFAQMTSSGLTMKAAQAVAKQYYPVNFAFPLFLAAAISHTPNDVARILLVDNLYEEHGSSKLEDSHTRLFEHFIRAVGLNPEECRVAPSGSPEEETVNQYNRLCYSGEQHQALAVLYAFEELFSPISEAISQGLKKSNILPEKDFTFFPLHGVVDIEHARKLREALLAVVSTDTEWAEALEAATIGAKTLSTLFDTIAQNSLK